MMAPTVFVAELARLLDRFGVPYLRNDQGAASLESMLASLEAQLKAEEAQDAQAVATVFNQIRAEAMTAFAGVLVRDFGLSEKRVARAARQTLDLLERIDAETVPEVARAILEEE